jgi:hypothetical protein
VQVLRDQTNGLTLLAYDAWAQGAKRQFKLAKSSSGETKRQYIAAAKQLQTIANTMVVTAPTNCLAATDNPDSYRAPKPEFVYKNSASVKLVRERSKTILQKASSELPLNG